jgi:hypothetical protein
MSPIRRQMKKRNPSGGQNGQLVHWWVLIHSGPFRGDKVVTDEKVSLALQEEKTSKPPTELPPQTLNSRSQDGP